MIKVLSIDVGIINLGYVWSEITLPDIPQTNKIKNLIFNQIYSFESTKKNIKVIDCNRIDITKVKHNKISRECCKLHHESCIPDYLDHFVQEHSSYFENCDILLIERQPPIGITNVQDLLFTRFRDKVLLVSPNTIHKYFGLSNEYDIRKIESERIALPHLNNFIKWGNNIRKHDISDALLMIFYFYKTKIDTLIENTIFEKEKDCDFDKFRFNFNG